MASTLGGQRKNEGVRSPAPHLVVARAETRRGWRSLVALAAIIGVAGAAVLFGLQAMRTSSSALDRYFDEADTNDATFALEQGGAGAAADVVATLPEVTATYLVHNYPVGVDGERLVVQTSPDAGYGTDIDRLQLVAGRLPHAADEVVVNEAAVDALGLRVGDVVPVRTLTADALTQFVDGRLP